MPGAAAAPQTADIAVKGNRLVDAAAIRSHFHAGRDGRRDAEAVDAALNELYASGQFDSIDVTRAGGRILVAAYDITQPFQFGAGPL